MQLKQNWINQGWGQGGAGRGEVASDIRCSSASAG